MTKPWSAVVVVAAAAAVRDAVVEVGSSDCHRHLLVLTMRLTMVMRSLR